MTSRRQFLQQLAAATALVGAGGRARAQRGRPNILLAISDDQGWPDASAYGSRFCRTPHFDRVAREGVLLHQAWCPAPQCAPCRASLVLGRPIWQNEEAGTHASVFPNRWPAYPLHLEAAGYRSGFTGKSVGPADLKRGGWERHPCGDSFNRRRTEGPASGIGGNDYAANFTDFLASREPGQPFCFLYGASEPHRVYERGSGLKLGRRLDEVDVPPYLPDNEIVRGDLLDYAVEIEWFDQHLGRIMATLEAAGELDNTLLVVTGDNGQPFPRAKANLYDVGCRAPMAIRWPAGIPAGREITDFVSFSDLFATFCEAAGVAPPETVTGRSALASLTATGSGLVDPTRDRVYAGRERHTHARPDNLGYPARLVRTHRHALIWNLKPDLWPAGNPLGNEGYFDIDGGPTKTLMNERAGTDEEIRRLWDLAVAKRPEIELYDLDRDPHQLVNVAQQSAYRAIRDELLADLKATLIRQGDPRLGPHPDVWDSYPRCSPMRPQLGGFAEEGRYNPAFLIEGQRTY